MMTRFSAWNILFRIRAEKQNGFVKVIKSLTQIHPVDHISCKLREEKAYFSSRFANCLTSRHCDWSANENILFYVTKCECLPKMFIFIIIQGSFISKK